jgi:hypothetical protein
MLEQLTKKYLEIKKLQKQYHQENQEFEATFGFILKLMRNRKDYMGSESNKDILKTLSDKEYSLISLMDTIHNLKVDMYTIVREIINLPQPAKESVGAEDSDISKILRHHAENLAANLREHGLNCQVLDIKHIPPEENN